MSACLRALGSHPSRGAWIEMPRNAHGLQGGTGRTPHGVRGLKWRTRNGHGRRYRRTPHGVRGLKFWIFVGRQTEVESHPSRGAWIEMPDRRRNSGRWSGRTPHGVRGLKFGSPVVISAVEESHPSRGAWIEISSVACTTISTRSHPSRGAWIEIRCRASTNACEMCVAPLTGCVD